ncbi:histidine kinase [Novosphingobium sp. PhB165]|uniref:sensor histidine kinase n=1 Tax=Novosphingobium sp. PhB165 TaxID=2485105 RepID=UPI001043AE8F|nr:histidine kinase [Novosphingobium sp. PhB165]
MAAARNTLLITDPNRLIALGRLVTACFAILAIYLDPTRPGRFLPEARHVLAFYLAYALVLVVAPVRRPVDSPVHFLFHVADTAILGWLAFLTDELTSPFFSFLPFTLMAMTVRWGFIGAIMGAFLLEIALFAIGIPDTLDGESELNVLIARSVYFLLSALMLGYFGAYRESSRERLARLAKWPMERALGSRRAWLGELCSHAGDVTGSRHMMVVWREHDRPDGVVAVWNGDGVELADLENSVLWDRVEVDRAGIFDRGEGRVLTRGEADAFAILLDHLRLPLVPVRDFAVMAGFSGLRFRGSILIADPDCRPEDAALLCDIIATRAGSELERIDLVARHSDNVRAEERNRLAQDLHDSVLQDLTATSLKLRALAARAGSLTPEEAGGQTREIEDLVTEQQRRIRRFVEDHREARAERAVDVADELRRQAELLQRKWGVAMPFDWEGAPIHLRRRTVEDIVQLVSEATSNAVRHGSASSVRLRAGHTGGAMHLTLVDNGTGLCASGGQGSISLRARVLQLGGSMFLAGGTPGLEVTMVIPVGELAA